jgi:hypothetical protein
VHKPLISLTFLRLAGGNLRACTAPRQRGIHPGRAHPAIRSKLKMPVAL